MVLTQTSSSPPHRDGRNGDPEAHPHIPQPTTTLDLRNLTRSAHDVVMFSMEEARRFNHNYVGTEHLLLALLRGSDNRAHDVLLTLGLELFKVRSAVEFIVGRGERQVTGAIGLTPRAKEAIRLAKDEARRLDHPATGPEHILLGLIGEGEGIAAGVLESLGMSLERVRPEVEKLPPPHAEEAQFEVDEMMPATPTVVWQYLVVRTVRRDGEPRIEPGEDLPDRLAGMRLQDALPHLGAAGWELAGIDQALESNGPGTLYIFKRPG